MAIVIRKALLADLEAITGIYNDAIVHTTATFDTEEKSVSDMLSWYAKHDDKYCLFVADENGTIGGWGSLSRWSDRCAYDDTAELSVYVHKDYRGRGLARQLMQAVLDVGKANGVHSVLSRITTDNTISIHLHDLFGFEHVGTLREVGRKFGRLLDVLMLQKILS